MANDLYREIILDHYHRPQFKGEILGAQFLYREANPLCGDVLSFQLRLDGERIVEVGWQGEGCAISIAAADMVAETIVGMSLHEVRQMNKEQVLELLGVDLGPTRLKCALLGLSCLQGGLREVVT
jgi:nitrogen fixation NifU-like protein